MVHFFFGQIDSVQIKFAYFTTGATASSFCLQSLYLFLLFIMVFVRVFVIGSFRFNAQRRTGRLPTSVRYFFGTSIYLMSLECVFFLGYVYRAYVFRIGFYRYNLSRSGRRLFYVFAAHVDNGRLVRHVKVVYSYLAYSSSFVFRAKRE